MMLFFLLAGGLSVAVMLLHLFAGGPVVAAPLLAAQDLKKVPKYTQYYCWHLVSISLGLLGLCFLWPALLGGSDDLALLGTVMAALYALWGLVLPFLSARRLSYLELPQGWLFVPIALLGLLGVWA